MSAPPPSSPQTGLRGIVARIPRPLLIRFALLVVFVATAFALVTLTPLREYMDKEKLAALLERLRGEWWAPLVLIGSFILLCPVIPATPLLVAGGIVFGFFWGTVYNVVGTYLGGVVTYFLGRALGRDFFVHLLGKRLKPVERAIARRGFWSLVGLRFLPIPYMLVNYCAAFVGIRPAYFLTTTLLGLIPSLTIFTYFSATLARLGSADKTKTMIQFGVATLLIISLAIGPQIWMARKRKKRYRDLMARRRGRGRGRGRV
jgi:uncharacterized membrane protein YdjX (TVP38/TMEM64 family)